MKQERPDTLNEQSVSATLTRRMPCRSTSSDEGPELVVIASGTYVMGSPPKEDGRRDNEGPQHKVTIVRPFAIGRCEVTVGEFGRFVRDASYVTTAEQSGGCYVWNDTEKKAEQKADVNWRNPGFEQTEDRPVVCVSYQDALVYVDWLDQRTGKRGYRLPTEAEWEYAARAGTTTARFWGDGADAACDYANVADQAAKEVFPDWSVHACSDGHVYTAPVGLFSANGYGLYDMLGNVWEWTQDCWHENYEGAPVNGKAWEKEPAVDCGRRVIRGGSWFDKPVDARSAIRDWSNTGEADSNLGFRLARTL